MWLTVTMASPFLRGASLKFKAMPYIKCPECDGAGFIEAENEEGVLVEQDCSVCEGDGSILDEQIPEE